MYFDRVGYLFKNVINILDTCTLPLNPILFTAENDKGTANAN